MKKKAKSSLTLSVPEAGKKYFGIGRNAAYRAAEAGQIPVIKIGALLRVPIAMMDRKMAGEA